jgi:RNA polymerase sigma-70 factor (ECF subfamily)
VLDLRGAYETEADTVFAFLARFGVRPSDLEDAVHDTFVAALARAATYDPSRPLRPWLLGIAFRVAVARMRHGRTREDSASTLDEVDPNQDPEQALARRRAGDLAERALAQLPEEQRAVFVLHDLQQLTMGDIAVSLEIPLNTAYSRLRLARVAFKRHVEELKRAGGRL